MKALRLFLCLLITISINATSGFAGSHDKLVALAEMARDGFQGFSSLSIEELEQMPFHLLGTRPLYFDVYNPPVMKYESAYDPVWHGEETKQKFFTASFNGLSKATAEDLVKKLEKSMGARYSAQVNEERLTFGYETNEVTTIVFLADIDIEKWEVVEKTELEYPVIVFERTKGVGSDYHAIKYEIIRPKIYFYSKHSKFAWTKFPGIPKGVATRSDHNFFSTPRKVKTIQNPGKENEDYHIELYDKGGIYRSYAAKVEDKSIDTFSFTVHPDGYIDYTHWYVTMAFEIGGEPEVMFDEETFYGPELVPTKIISSGNEEKIENTFNDKGQLILKKKGNWEYEYEYDGLLKTKEITKFYGKVDKTITYKYDIKGRLIHKKLDKPSTDATVIDTVMYDDENMTRTEARVKIEDDGTERATVRIFNEYGLQFYGEEYLNNEKTKSYQLRYQYDSKGNWIRQEVYENDELIRVQAREISYW